MKDIVYFYDKKTFERYELGEIQDEFNMSFVIDGTKDSAKLIVYNFSEKKIEPFTIVKHENTSSWWVITNDKVERYLNESGFMYVHNLTLLGAIELLNHRDLTNCGFTERRYTISQIALRIMKLSNFELNTYFLSNNLVDPNKQVEYLKSFENYTPLSALSEFFDGYNCSIKMSFNESTHGTPTTYYISSANLYLVSKVGNNSNYIEDIFNNVQETKTMDSKSFGTTALSNADNVISSISKTYPLTGSVALSSEAHTIDNTNGIVRLPSPVYSVNWVKMFPSLVFRVRWVSTGDTYSANENVISDESEVDNAINQIAQRMRNNNYNALANALLNSYKDYYETFLNACSITFNKVIGYDTNTNELKSDKQLPFLYSTYMAGLVSILNVQHEIGVSTKQLRDSLERPEYCFYYEQGKDYIGGFNLLDNYNGEDFPQRHTMVNINSMGTPMTNYGGWFIFLTYETQYEGTTYQFQFEMSGLQLPVLSAPPETYVLNTHLSSASVRFKVNYIPMSEIKIKYNNNGIGNDTQLYNQTGKLNDGVALSKLILSYVDQIESDNITKFATFHDYDDVPQCGQVVKISNNFYVINNVSLTFYENENDTYFIKGEFTLSKNIATKSLLVNPNSDIRDYNIPQNENVKRIQLYRDFYEIGHTIDTNSTIDWYMPITKLLNVSNVKNNQDEHTCVMKLTYDREVNNSDTYYYQLDTIKYVFKKSMYEIVNFKDNNIIGYDSQSVYTGFDITKLFTHIRDMINTPISYTDSYGEVKDIYIAWCSGEQLLTQYKNLALDSNNTLVSSQISVHTFIPSEIYEGNGANVNGAKVDNDFLISEINYKKDAIEVPVFEYSCQLDNSGDVIIGDDIFDNSENSFYIYEIFRVNKNSINENNYTILTSEEIEFLVGNYIWFPHSCAKIEYSSSVVISITQYNSIYIHENGNEITYGTKENISGTQDYVIVRRNISQLSSYTKNASDVVFGKTSDGYITYEINVNDGETISDITCELANGYRDDQPYSTCSFTSDRVQYVVGGVNYNDTIAYATLTITINVPTQTINGSKGVAGRASLGSRYAVLNLDGNYDTLVNGSVQISVEGDGNYANIISIDYDNFIVEYEIGNYSQPNLTVSGTITYTYVSSSHTRTIVESVSGTKLDTQYYLVPLDASETIQSATISNIELQNNNLAGAFMNIISTSGNIVTYEIGCNNMNTIVKGLIKWKVSGQSRDTSRDLLFVVRNMENATIENGVLKLNINHYKLK